MQTLLSITAPIIYILIMLFSAWIGFLSSNSNRHQRRGVNLTPIIAILAGLATCPLVAVLIQLGHLSLPSIQITFPFICVTLGIGFVVGLIYIWSANLVLGNEATISLFVLGSVGGSAICLYFYFFQSEVQELLISSAWGFLFGVLVYMVLKGGPGSALSNLHRK